MSVVYIKRDGVTKVFKPHQTKSQTKDLLLKYITHCIYYSLEKSFAKLYFFKSLSLFLFPETHQQELFQGGGFAYIFQNGSFGTDLFSKTLYRRCIEFAPTPSYALEFYNMCGGNFLPGSERGELSWG